jgi:hypothetical protein
MTRSALFTAAALLIASSSYATTAEEMLVGCRAVAQAPVRDGQVQIPRAPDAQMCWGAFDVVHALTGFFAQGKPILGICVPDDSTVTQLAAVFVEHVDRNPAVRSQGFVHVTMNALIKAFPCASRAKK